MADCSDLISLQDQKDAKVNADSINEFVNSDNPSMVTLEGKTKKTVQGIADDGAAALAQFEIDAGTAISASGFEIIGDFSDATKAQITSPNQRYTSRTVTDFEDYVWRYTGVLPYTPTESTPIGNDWVATAIGELETIARSLNIPKENIMYGTVGASIAANITHIYVSEQQTTYAKPADVPDGEVIVSIVSDALETNLGTYILLPLKIQGEYVQPVNDSYTMDEYLGNKGIFAATEQQIQDANDYIVSTGKRTKITLPQSAVIPILNGITLDASYVTLDGSFSGLDCTAMTTGTAITITGTRQPPYYQNKDVINNLTLYGVSRTSNVGGLLFSNPNSVDGEGPSHTVMNNVTIQNFGIGEEYKDRAYLTTANNCDIFNCGTALKCSVAVDGGENMRRFGGAIFNSNQAIEMNNPNGTLFLSGVSIDYCGKIANVTGGQVILSCCHVEAHDYSDVPVTISGSGSNIAVQNGWWLLTSSSTKSFSHWVDAAANTDFSLSDVRMNNTRTATDEFATGEGYVSIVGLNSFETHGNCRVLHSDRSKLIDGGFELSNIVDDVFIVADTQPITDRHTGVNIQLAITADDARTGAQSLKYTKPFGGGSASEFVLISMPVTSNQQVGGRFYWRKPAGVSTGSVLFNFQFVKLQNDANGVPTLIHTEAKGGITIPLTADDTGWAERAFDNTVWKAPSWATHFIVRVNGFSWGGGGEPIYFDDLTVDVVG